MTDHQPAAASPPGAASPPDATSEPTWQRVERTAAFQELVARKRRWVRPATAFFLVWFLAFVLAAGYAPDWMGGEFLVDGLTVGYVFALTQFAMTFGLAIAYVRRSRDVFDPLREQALREGGDGGLGVPAGGGPVGDDGGAVSPTRPEAVR
jgi:uncharacterized membrane protein (DUF485 family)